MSTLKVNKLRDTAGSADAITLDPNGGAVLAGVTTISTARITTGITTSIQVGGGVTISESGIEASGIGITCANINGAAIGGSRNLVINGSMMVAQRGTSSTTTSEFVVDRFRHAFSKASDGVTLTYSQATLGTSDSPYSEGHRYYIREALSGSTSDASSYYVQVAETRLEAQDIAMSGWNYTDPNSKLTLSFWARSSVAMTYGYVLQTHDGTAKLFPKTFALSANTWTKIKYSVPGHADLTFNNDTNNGLTFKIYPYLGSGYCGGTDGAWGDQSAGKYGSDNTAVTWLGGANTFDVTGLQLEAGSQATAFEHRRYSDELTRCHRYYYKSKNDSGAASEHWWGNCTQHSATQARGCIVFPTPMRGVPSAFETSGSADHFRVWYKNNASTGCSSVPTTDAASSRSARLTFTTSSGLTAGEGASYRANSTDAYIAWSAEL